MAKVEQIPRKFVGTYSPDDADKLADVLGADEDLVRLFARYWLTHGHSESIDDARDFLFRLQLLMEATEQRVFNPQHEVECMDGDAS